MVAAKGSPFKVILSKNQRAAITGASYLVNQLRVGQIPARVADEYLGLRHGLIGQETTGIVTEALNRHTSDVPVVGVCNVGITNRMGILEQIEKLLGQRIEPERAVLQTLGLNHLTWHCGFTVDGEDLWPRLFPAISNSCARKKNPNGMCTRSSRSG